MDKYYYKLHFSKVYRDKINNDYLCYIDLLPVRKLGKRNKQDAVVVQTAATYAIAVIFKAEKELTRPRYLVSDKDNVKDVRFDLHNENQHLTEVLRKYSEKTLDKQEKVVLE